MTPPPTALLDPARPRTALERARTTLQLEGPERLADHELLALCLGPHRRGDPLVFASKILELVGGLRSLCTLRTSGMSLNAKMSPSQACRIVAALELGRRATLDRIRPLPERRLGQQGVSDWARPRLAGLDHEEVWVLCVNAASQLQSTFQVGRGGIHGCGLLPRDILTPVVREAAGGFVLVHNHPSGDPCPSPEDVELTRSLQRASLTLGVPLLDHVIVARNGVTSFFEEGLLDS